jgi:hypothetical protein
VLATSYGLVKMAYTPINPCLFTQGILATTSYY